MDGAFTIGIGEVNMSWARIAAPLVLLAFIGLGMGVLRPVLGGDASPSPQGTGTDETTPEEYIAAHEKSMADSEWVLRQEEFLHEFKASGDDPFELKRTTVIAMWVGGAEDLRDLRSESVAVVRGTVTSQTYYGRAGKLGLTAQFFCYSVMTVSVEETLSGDAAETVTVVSPGCPTLQGENPVFLYYRWDPPLENGREYVLFLRPGDDSNWADSAFPEGHREAGVHFHLGDPAAQYEITDGRLGPNEFTPGWAHALDGATIDEFKSYLANPDSLPESTWVEPTHDPKDPPED